MKSSKSVWAYMKQLRGKTSKSYNDVIFNENKSGKI